MSLFESSWNAASDTAQARRARMLARIEAWRALEQRSADKSVEAAARIDKRGQLLHRERLALQLRQAQKLEAIGRWPRWPAICATCPSPINRCPVAA